MARGPPRGRRRRSDGEAESAQGAFGGGQTFGMHGMPGADLHAAVACLQPRSQPLARPHLICQRQPQLNLSSQLQAGGRQRRSCTGMEASVPQCCILRVMQGRPARSKHTPTQAQHSL